MSLIIRELQIETTMRYHLTPVRIGIIKKSTNNKFWKAGREQRTLLHYWWECKLIQPLWNFSFQFIHQNFWLLTESDILRYATLKIHLVWGATVVFQLYKNTGLKPVTRADKDLVCTDNFLLSWKMFVLLTVLYSPLLDSTIGMLCKHSLCWKISFPLSSNTPQVSVSKIIFPFPGGEILRAVVAFGPTLPASK